MPELPEVETARVVIAAGALHRQVVDVDDSDTWVLRPHAPGEIRSALVGRSLVAVHRRGKSMWCDLSDGGPTLGIHLGMSGKVVLVAPDGDEVDGGDYWGRGRERGDHRFTRFAVTFVDGGRLLLVDPRRLGRVRLDPPVENLGPDARGLSPKQLGAVLARGSVAVKGRLLDQEKVAGIGNLLAGRGFVAGQGVPAPAGRRADKAPGGPARGSAADRGRTRGTGTAASTRSR